MNTNKTADMERKLESRDICGYLPHRLLAKTKIRNERIYEVIAISSINYISLIPARPGVVGFEGLYLSGVIPILRPLSDLYRTITHNGKEITPIVELAKIAFPGRIWTRNRANNKIVSIPSAITDNGTFCWCFYFERQSFHVKYINLQSRMGDSLYLHGQAYLFDYLHELKIDYRNLIDSGLAIDANTLETNPYK